LTIQQILIKYWGYTLFRPLQEDIINSVLSGKDTLALLPTGGGKSVCFQVPALAKKGVCIVISPLIALMKDQVENLKKKGIKAVAIYSGMHREEIDIAFDNCIYGNVKFLYLSPERLETELAKARIGKMNVNLIAVDEAHCISQWGYDFRPPYLRIAEIRKLLPDVPVLALTATAIPKVVEDIQEKLLFKEKNVFRKSFERKNLIYVVLKKEDKLNKLLNIANNVKGTGIVYVRSRRKTREIASFFQKHNIKANYYHAGLSPKIRNLRHNEWMEGTSRIIVSTNAFGMGIDKSNVRFVVHLDLPDSVEAYFQEAGRAGRDEKKAYAVLLFSDSDIINLKHSLSISYPDFDKIKNVYQSLGNYFQLAVGISPDVTFDFDIADFCNNYNLKPLMVYNCLKFLEKEGYIVVTEAVFSPSRIHFNMNREDLYSFQVANANYDNFIKIVLRSYTGVFNDFAKVNETELSNRAGISKNKIIEYFKRLHKLEVLTYIAQTDKAQIMFCNGRIDSKNIDVSKKNYIKRKDIALKRIEAIIDYVTEITKCRSQFLLSYFGETDSKRCGKCDVCIGRNKLNLSELEFDTVLDKIKPVLRENALSVDELIKSVGIGDKDKIIEVIQWLLDNGKIYSDTDNKLRWEK